MKNYFLMLIFSSILLQASDFQKVLTLEELQGIDKNRTVELVLHYADFDWDMGLVGGLIYDGIQIDDKRASIGAGVYIGYHLNNYVSFHGEGIGFFTSYAPKIEWEETRSNMYLGSAQYDFTADRPFSLFVKAGLGYEVLDRYNVATQHNIISMMGLGLRYMFTNRVSAYIEGRWKYKLKSLTDDFVEIDNSLMGTIGIGYHFGISEEKSQLLKAVYTHNKRIK